MTSGFAIVLVGGVLPFVTLDEVLESVDVHAPVVIGALADVERAEGQLRAARAPFDLMVKGDVGATPIGAYGERGAQVEVQQTLPFLGVTAYSGYRFGDDFAPYEGKNTTSGLGEVRGGVRVPLLRGLLTDGARTARETARLDVDAARFGVERTRLGLRARAAAQYVAFVGARARREIALDLLQVAEERQASIEAQVRAGAVAEIEALDNARLILSRKERLVAADRELASAAYALAFFLRDDEGAMRVATLADAPRLPGPYTADLDVESLVVAAIARRPELVVVKKRADAERERLRLAENDLWPTLTVDVSASQDMGEPRAISETLTTKNTTELGVGVGLSLPVQQSAARGRARSHRATLRVLDAELQVAREQIELDVRDAANALLLSQQQVGIALDAARLAERLEEAERTRLALGQSTLLVVNLREQQAAAARESVIAAEMTALLARVRLDAATGLLLDAPPRFVGDAPSARAHKLVDG